MFKCSRCEKEFESYNSLMLHSGKAHKVHQPEFYIEFYCNGVHPTCQCGCGELMKWDAGKKQFRMFKAGHGTRVHNPCVWLTDRAEEARAKMSATNRAQFASGERVTWSKGLSIKDNPILQEAARKVSANKERSAKISKALTGVKKSEEHKKNSSIGIKKYWADPAVREEQSHKRMLYITKNGFETRSKLEPKFEVLLQLLNLRYHDQHYVREIKSLYDFYLSDYKVIIEVHGDYWHCNPNSKYAVPEYAAQFSNIENDKKKAEWCVRNNIPLLIFWETDINNNPSGVMDTLKQFLSTLPPIE